MIAPLTKQQGCIVGAEGPTPPSGVVVALVFLLCLMTYMTGSAYLYPELVDKDASEIWPIVLVWYVAVLYWLAYAVNQLRYTCKHGFMPNECEWCMLENKTHFTQSDLSG